MKKSLSCLAVIVLCSFGLASVSFAQKMRGYPPMFGVFNPKVGVGADYEIQTQDGKAYTEVAIVGKETVDGKDAYWLETAERLSERTTHEIVFKTLLIMDGDNTYSSKVIMQLGGKHPVEGPGTGRAHSRVPTDARADAEDLGSESVTVPAGTFTVEHYRAKDGSADTWISIGVGPYGLVKYHGKAVHSDDLGLYQVTSTWVLTKVFSDYKDKITGPPGLRFP